MTVRQTQILSLLNDVLTEARARNIKENQERGVFGEDFVVHYLRIIGETLLEEFSDSGVT
jgi:hypothetical protein